AYKIIEVIIRIRALNFYDTIITYKAVRLSTYEIIFRMELPTHHINRTYIIYLIGLPCKRLVLIAPSYWECVKLGRFYSHNSHHNVFGVSSCCLTKLLATPAPCQDL